MDKSSGQGGRQGQSSTYKVNVNRTKTRKWVEAKVQSYDGDDWGAPDDIDEEDEPESPTEPVAPIQPKITGSRLPSDTRVPGTRRPTFPLSPVNPPPQEVISTPNHPAQEVISTPNHPDAPFFSGPPNAGIPAQDNTVHSPVAAADTDGPPGARRLSFEAQPVEPAPRRDSTSPRLPDVGRMSTFGSDFFSPPGSDAPGQGIAKDSLHDSGKAPLANESAKEPDVVAPNPQRPPIPGNWVTESPSPALSTPIESKQHSPQPAYDNPILPPLVTSSSANESHMIPPPLGSQGAEEARHGITPPEPLEPSNIPQTTPSDYEPPQHLTKASTLDTNSSSPVKESDVLSDEIMRSLTPGGLSSSSAAALDKFPPSEDAAGPSRTPTAADLGAPSREPDIASPANNHQLQHRFSWEAPGSEPAKPPQPSVTIPDTKVTVTGVQTSTVAPPVEATTASSPVSIPSTQPISPTIFMVPDSKSPDFLSKTSMDGPASPDSDTRDEAGPSFPVPTAQSLQKETLSPSPAPTDDDGLSAPIQPPPKDKPIMPFKDITELSSSDRRVEKFEETRKDVATTDSGLNNWVLMMTRHPDHSNATSSMSGSGPLPTATLHPSSSFGATGSTQDKGSGTKPAAAAARARLAGLQEQAQAAAGNAFGHSGGQIGHKSKEFMQSAGKMGKGLFSKGRSKLRGTGDK